MLKIQQQQPESSKHAGLTSPIMLFLTYFLGVHLLCDIPLPLRAKGQGKCLCPVQGKALFSLALRDVAKSRVCIIQALLENSCF